MSQGLVDRRTDENFSSVQNQCAEYSAQPDYISNLPPDILYEIIKYFTPQEISVRIATLSKKFYSYSKNPLLWRHLNFEPFPKFSMQKILRIMVHAINQQQYNNMTNLTTGVLYLNLQGRETLDYNELIEMAPYLNTLKYLNISSCFGVNEAFMEILPQACPNLQILIAKGCGMLNEPGFCLISRLKKLKTLQLNHDIDMTDLALVTIGNGLEYLEVITLKGIMNFYDKGIEMFVQERGTTLKKLEFDGSFITDSSMAKIRQECLSKLEILLVHSANRLTDASLDSVKDISTLKSLKLARCKKFTESGFIDFFETNQLDRLEGIDFSECKSVTNAVLEKMSYKHRGKLKRLSLSFCWTIDDDGFLTILDNFPNLEILELAGLNRLTWLHVPEIPEKLQKLKYLDLRQCNTWIDDDVVKIVQKMPQLMVINFLGYEVYQKPGIGIIHSPRRMCE